MKINSVSTRQFAGLHKTNVDFKDGINVVYGKNESGKSTLVNLMSRTLFQDVKLKKNSDKDFINSYFPTNKKGSISKADYINGEIEFETNDGKYVLEKTWSLGNKEECFLEFPDESSISNNDEINKNVVSALEYGEGVYSNILLSSQRNTDLSLQDILGEDGEIKNDLVDVLTTAFVEDSDISIDAIENSINNNINDLAGKYWDIENMEPTSSKRMQKNMGSVASAYWDVKDAKKVLEEVSKFDDELNNIFEEYEETNKKYLEAKDKYESFSKISSVLGKVKLIEKNLENDKLANEKVNNALKEWPILDKNYNDIKTLNEELKNRGIIAKYEEANMANKELEDAKNKLVTLANPTEDEIDIYSESINNINILKSKLSGMNIKAKIKMLDNHKIEINSLLTGTKVSIKDEISIDEAVDIKVPGVMEMCLIPGNIDVKKIDADIKKNEDYIEKINIKYNVKSLEELKKLANTYKEENNNVADFEDALDDILNGENLKDLERKAKAIKKMPRQLDRINADIKKICGKDDPEKYLIEAEFNLKQYKSEYKDIDSLNRKASELINNICKYRNELDKVGEMSKEFKNISDPDEYLNDLKEALEKLNNELMEISNKKTTISVQYKGFVDSFENEPKDVLEECNRRYDEQLSLLKHWIHIKRVFNKQREQIKDNPLVNLAKNFTNYLNEMTDEKVESELPKVDKLDINIYSNNSELDYSKLSEGTKETVSLAFRLAVLDHLFPNGGGIAVFDDSLANMDDLRTAKAIKIIQEFSKKHQVIFLTCKEEIKDKLGGNLIEI